jgi:sugar phosphate isomerase/epimerase
MKVGYHIYLERDPYNTIKEAVQKYGVDNGTILVWDMSLYTEENIKEIKRACKDFNFEVTAVWCGWSERTVWSYPEKYVTVGLVPAETREQRVKDILKGTWFANELGVKLVITHPGYVPDSPYDETHIAVVDAFRSICREIKKNGQTFLFETGEMLPVTLIQMMLEIGEDNIGINFDPSNLTTSGRADATVAMKLLAPYVKGFHAKDGTFPQGTNAHGKQVRVVGTGEVDFPSIIRILKEHNYEGTLAIEHETASDNRDQDILDTKAYLESLIASV